MLNENPVLVDSSARARTTAIHGLRKAPAILSVQGRGYDDNRIDQSVVSILDGGLLTRSLEEAPSKVVGESNGQPGVANTVRCSGGVSSSEEMQRPSAYGHETRSAFPHESKRVSFDSKRQSVHVALENYGLNCPVSAPPSPMRSKSALGRDLIPRTPRALLRTSRDGQIDSLFDHDAEHFEIPAETEYRYLKTEDDSSTGVQAKAFLLGRASGTSTISRRE